MFKFNDLQYLTFEDEIQFANGPAQATWSYRQVNLKLLGFFSEKTGHFINEAINFKRNKSAAKYGLFNQCSIYVVINSVGEVGLKFNNYENINKYIRSAQGNSERINSIRDKVANALKEFWKLYEFQNGDVPYTMRRKNKNNELTDFIIAKNEYRIIYEMLKNRQVNKIKQKYGKNTFESVVGNPIRDEFALGALDTIKAEIIKIRQAETQMIEEIKNEQRKKIEEIKNEQHKKIEAVNTEFYSKKDKIVNETSNQIKQLEIQLNNFIELAKNNEN